MDVLYMVYNQILSGHIKIKIFSRLIFQLYETFFFRSRCNIYSPPQDFSLNSVGLTEGNQTNSKFVKWYVVIFCLSSPETQTEI